MLASHSLLTVLYTKDTKCALYLDSTIFLSKNVETLLGIGDKIPKKNRIGIIIHVRISTYCVKIMAILMSSEGKKMMFSLLLK